MNDGTTDKSREVVERYEKSFKNFIIIDQVNQDLSMARNSGLAIAQGEYVYFLDSDDYVDAREFKSFLDQAIKLDVDIAVGNGRHLEGETLKHVLKKSAKVNQLGVVDGPTYYLCAYKYNEFHVAVWLKLYKRSFLQDSQLVFLAGIQHEDEEFMPRAFSLAKRVAYIDSYFYIYRHRIGSLTKSLNHKYCNSRSIPSFNKVVLSLSESIEKRDLSSAQKKTMTHGIYKCYLEILKRNYYHT